MEETFDNFLKAQALQFAIDREYRKLKYIVEHISKIMMIYTKFKGEEKLFRVVLIRKEKHNNLNFEHVYPKPSRVVEIHVPSINLWKELLPHLNDDIGLDTSDHKICDEALEKGLIFFLIDVKVLNTIKTL